ncbi:MAG: GyrI-like domain-containing protein [Gammaproteobacteria bacterium]|nr:GyrI-like domain-containing protein [Gammaproteobacteria bacterium]
MPDNIEVVHRDQQVSLAVECRASIFGIPKAMANAFNLITVHMEQQGIRPEAPSYTLYKYVVWDTDTKGITGFVRMIMHKWDMQIGIPVREQIAGNDRVIAAHIPAGRYLRTLHRGPYKTLGRTYERVQKYARDQGLLLANYMVERYLNDPHEVSQAQLETEVLIPLAE